MSDLIGYLTWFTVPAVAAPYEVLVELARVTGFPEDCVPAPPAPRNVWEKATNLGTRGIKVPAPPDLVRQVRERYDTDPIVRVLTRQVCGSAPTLKRHLVREAVIPLANRAKKQLSLETVAVLTFDVARAEYDHLAIPDEGGWVNGSIREILERVEARIDHLAGHADGDAVRYGFRNLLDSMHRVSLRNTGGVYFVPRSVPGSLERLYAMRDFAAGLGEWATGDTPYCRVIHLDGANAQELHDDLVDAAVVEYTDRLTELVASIQPVLAGRARGRVADRINRNALAEWFQIRDGLGAYRDSLQIGMDILGELIQSVTSQVQVAASQSFGDINLDSEDETIRRIL